MTAIQHLYKTTVNVMSVNPVYLNNACVVRAAEETEEYQRVATNVGKGLSVIQEELHRMRMATKAQVDSLALQREVNQCAPFNICLDCLV